jgi:hypothetical protein
MHARSTRPAHAARLDETDCSTPAHLQDLSFLCDEDDTGRGTPSGGPSGRARTVDRAFTGLRALARKSGRFFARLAPVAPSVGRVLNQDRATVK